jgi:hypothetical protein
MDLTTLRDSLDSSSRERHPASVSAKRSEVRLTRDFKAAALQLTTLYRTSLTTSKRSYAAGYAQSLNDILDVVSLRLQQSPATTPGFAASVRGASESDREELKWLSRYLRARVEAIKAETEEDDKLESDDDETNDGGSLGGSIHIDNTQPGVSQRVNPTTSSSVERRRLSSSNAMTGIQDSIPDLAGHSTNRVPSQTTFTFTVPGTSGALEQTPKVRRSRRPESPSVNSANQTSVGVTTGNQHLTHDQRRAILRAASSSDDEESVQLPSPARGNANQGRRTTSRGGKRTGGRDKLSGLELFARAQNAKRRRGMGDRRDEDFDDTIL